MTMRNYMNRILSLFVGVLISICVICPALVAQTNVFTYQGSLTTAGSPANGNHDFEFALFDTLGGANQVGTTLTRSNVVVTNGVFSVSLDFGNQFPGLNRFLEIRVRPSGGGGFTTLTPRQQVNSAPYAIKSVAAESAVTALNATNAATSINATQLGGVAANQYVLTTDPRMTDARAPTAGSTSYIQNQNAGPQSSSSFNISGSGTVGGTLSAGTVNVSSQYNIGGTRILSTPGSQNVFIGAFTGGSGSTVLRNTYVGAGAGTNVLQNNANENSYFGAGAGAANTEGDRNSIFGVDAGFQNIASNNSFFGAKTGQQNTTGTLNAFFGESAGTLNTTASSNSFFGADSGASTTTGGGNSFFGTGSGQDNVDGIQNSFFGENAGRANTSGNSNAYFGRHAGRNTSTGSSNTMVGFSAGDANNTGSSLTLIGANADVGSDGLTFATAIGAGAVVATSSTVQIGRGSDTVNLPGKLKLNILGSAGATAICRNASAEISTCSSSERYKSNINAFNPGLSLINRLRPVSFNWRDGGMLDLGLVAEEVAKVEPLLTTTNTKGEVEGVKYDRVGVVLINAVKEQQAQIQAQSELIKRQQQQIDALTKLVCATNADAVICEK